ncbi:hypothetical protein RT99_14065 [Flavobacterium sp. MEB061]|uniref:DUF4062 domain-containing protein n=1 Tax=Flavobacterium sp. MEB061 TaxID=1587524 RepID=UPI0005ACE1AC|nr:DUF4062 domain-containing protein [Flavobacterium sp. MEB061]KIQ20194.1 hypothetical protein RT99_14065 [Flavobacterium sp. MEB061]
MKKPVFFISSTIFDFKDLRSSIKWWLEENDYIVNASEFNDFDKPLDVNSYDACLNAIDNSDYFILLIGDRIGGMYDDDITITQKEYQHAYSRMLKNNLKIIAFIRQDTWTNFNVIREKIKELKKDPKIDESIVEDILKKEEKIRFKFIDEVRRVEEMRVGERPKNNWIHNFNTFKDVTEVFRRELGGRFDLNFKQNRFVVLNDLKLNLQRISSKHEEGLFPIGFMSTDLWKDFKFNPDKLQITLTQGQYINYAAFYASCWQIKPLIGSRIESFYRSGFFLEYDKKVNDFTSGHINQMVVKLLNNYERLNKLHLSIFKDSSKMLKLRKKEDLSHLKVSPLEIFLALEFYDEMHNCFNLSKNLNKALKGKKYETPLIRKNERLPEEMIVKEKDLVTLADIENYLDS